MLLGIRQSFGGFLPRHCHFKIHPIIKWNFIMKSRTAGKYQLINFRPLANSCQSVVRSLPKQYKVSYWVKFSSRIQAAIAVGRTVQHSFSKCLARHKPSLLLSSICLLQKYDFETNGISDATLDRYLEDNHVDYVNALMDSTVMCPVCEKRQVLQQKVPGVEYCECPDGGGVDVWSREWNGWQPFVEQSNVLVWRRPHPQWPHLYSYKVYGRYEDVSLCAFAETQLNCAYRRTWDTSVLELSVLCRDKLSEDQYSAQDLVYWLVKFPRFFSNRDYVFRRRYRADPRRRELVIVNEAVDEGQGVAAVGGVHRVHHYWSVMVVRGTHPHVDKPGVEYTLTYFDNPGTSLPSSITNFIASTAFPNFLQQLHGAAVTMQQQHALTNQGFTTVPSSLRTETLSKIPPKVSKLLRPKVDDQLEELPEVRVTLEPPSVTTELDTSSDIHSIMEALGEIVPYENGNLLQRLDDIIMGKIKTLDETNVLFSKLKIFKNKLDKFRLEGRIKKNESISIMKEFERRHNRYEDHHTTPLLVQQLMDSMNEVLKADHDMRTGRGLLISDNTDLHLFSQKPKNKEDGTNNINSLNIGEKIVSSIDTKDRTDVDNNFSNEDSLSKNELHEESNDSSWSAWLYFVFIEKPVSIFKSSKPDPNDREKTDLKERRCAEDCEESPEGECGASSSGEANCPTQHSRNSVWYYVYGWLLWPPADSLPHQTGTSNSSTDYTSSEDNSTSEVSWYWKPISTSWRYGVWLVSCVVRL